MGYYVFIEGGKPKKIKIEKDTQMQTQTQEGTSNVFQALEGMNLQNSGLNQLSNLNQLPNSNPNSMSGVMLPDQNFLGNTMIKMKGKIVSYFKIIHQT